MAWRRSGDEPLSEPMMVSLPRIYASLGLNELTKRELYWITMTKAITGNYQLCVIWPIPPVCMSISGIAIFDVTTTHPLNAIMTSML